MKEHVYWHDPAIKNLLDNFEDQWTMETRLTRATVIEFCANRGLDVETDAAIHMVVSAFLEGEARVLAETVELTDSDGSGSNKSGLELWRLLKYNFDRSSAFNITSVLEMIRGLSPAKGMHEISPKLATLERAPKSTNGRLSHLETESSSICASTGARSTRRSSRRRTF